MQNLYNDLKKWYKMIAGNKYVKGKLAPSLKNKGGFIKSWFKREIKK